LFLHYLYSVPSATYTLTLHDALPIFTSTPQAGNPTTGLILILSVCMCLLLILGLLSVISKTGSHQAIPPPSNRLPRNQLLNPSLLRPQLRALWPRIVGMPRFNRALARTQNLIHDYQ